MFRQNHQHGERHGRKSTFARCVKKIGTTTIAWLVAAVCLISVSIPLAGSATAVETSPKASSTKSAQQTTNITTNGTDDEADATISTYSDLDAREVRDSSKLELDDQTVTSISIKYQTATKGDDGSLTYGEWQEMTPDANGSYHFDSYNNEDWRYRIKVEYHIPQGDLGDRDYLVYEIPKQLRVLENLSGPATNDSDDVVGTYTLSTDGYMIIKLNDSVVKGNADHPLDGSLRFDVQVSEQGKKDGETIDLPGKKDIITIGKSYDLHVAKTSGTRDKTNNTVPYTITVSTEYGTATNISLDDYLTNGTVEGDIVIKDKNGNTVTPLGAAECADVQGDATNRTFSTCLPKLNAGEQYTVTYMAKAGDANANGNKISNTAKVTSKDGNGNKLTDESTSDVYLSNKPGVEKTAGDRDENGNIKWTVTVNRNGDNLKGWTLRDLPGDGVDVPGNIQMRNTATGQTSNITLPYTFSGDDTGTYEITYVTATTKMQSDYSNTATLCPTTNEVPKDNLDSAGCSYAQTSKYVGSPFYKEPSGDPSYKVNSSDPNNQTIEMHWQMHINKDSWSAASIPGGWEISDTLQQADGSQHYFTEAQRKAFVDYAQNVAFAGMETPTITFYQRMWDGSLRPFTGTIGQQQKDVVGFKITSNQAIPKDKHIVLDYYSTGDLGDGTAWRSFKNSSTMGSFSSEPTINYNPPSKPSEPDQPDQPDQPDKPQKTTSSFEKYDPDYSNWAHASQTSHDYGNLNESETQPPTYNNVYKYLEWALVAKLGTDKLDSVDDGSTLTIKEHIPEGLHLLPNDARRWWQALGAIETRDNSTIGLNDRTPMTWSEDHQRYELKRQGSDELVAYATIDGQELVITVPSSSLKYAKEHMSNGIATIGFTIRLVPDADQFGKLSVTHMYKNTASAWFDKSKIGDGEQTQTVTRDALKDVVGKENINKTNGRATYQLDINPHSYCLPDDSKTLDGKKCKTEQYAFTDTAQYSHSSDFGNANLVLDPESVSIYTTDLDKSKGEETEIAPVKEVKREWVDSKKGYDYVVHYGDKVKVKKLTKSECSYVLTSNHPQNDSHWSETLHFTVPNGMHLYVQYTYKVHADYKDLEGSTMQWNPWISIQNSATLVGKVASPTDNSLAVNAEDAAASIKGIHVSAYKVDSTNNAELLQGAVFNLMAWDEQSKQWETVKDADDPSKNLELVSDENGKVSISTDQYRKLTYNHAYALKEIKAPAWYNCESEPHYFMLTFSNTEKYPVEAPSDFNSAKYGAEMMAPGSAMYFDDSPKDRDLPLTGMLGGARWIVLGGAVLAVIAGAFAMDSQRATRRRFC